jgi:hypothetical protein
VERGAHVEEAELWGGSSAVAKRAIYRVVHHMQHGGKGDWTGRLSVKGWW